MSTFLRRFATGRRSGRAPTGARNYHRYHFGEIEPTLIARSIAQFIEMLCDAHFVLPRVLGRAAVPGWGG